MKRLGHSGYRRNPMRYVILALLVALGPWSMLQAQFTTAKLTGSVVDTSGASVPGATVTARNMNTGFTRTTKSASTGAYQFPALPIGVYEVTVKATGFETYRQEGVTLATGQAVTLPVKLAVGAVSQQVVVHANASMVNTTSPTVSQVVNTRELVNLPLNSRHAQELVFLTPGASNVTANYCAAFCEGATFPSEQYAKINGAGANGVSYQLDGSSYNDPYLNTNLPFPNPDAIQDFDVMTTNMSAIYGGAIGGVVNVTLKSGTNGIHGDVFEFAQNSTFNARNWYAQSVSPEKQNQFGGTIGGPIIKNKLFYFGSYQGTRFSATNAGLSQFVPNAEERKGNFSFFSPGAATCAPFNTCFQLINPANGNPYPNNQVPVSPVATFLLGGIPLPNGAQLGLPGPPGFPNDNYFYNGLPTTQNTDEYLVKLDYSLSRNHLSGHYFRLKFSEPLVVASPTNTIQAVNDAETLVDNNVSVADVFTVSPRLVLGTYYGYSGINGHTYSSAPYTLDKAGIKIAEPPNRGNGDNGGLAFSASTFGVGTGTYGLWNRANQSIREIDTWTLGNHLLQFGGQAILLSQPMGNTFQQGGNFQFVNSLTGYNMADFMSGIASYFIQGGGLFLDFTGINWSAFVQDDWKATPRLTLSAGLRWDPWIPAKDSLGRVACFVPGAPESKRYPNAPMNLIYGGKNHDPGCPAAGIFADYANWGPRLGFAYQLSASGDESLRGGAGYYYEPPNSLIDQQIVGVPPFAPVITLTNVSFADPYGSAGVTSPFPAEFGPTNPGPNATFPSGAIGFSQLQDPHLKLPTILTYNLTFEQGFARGYLLRLAYFGNNAHRLYGTGDQESGLWQLNPAIYNPKLSPIENENTTQQRRVYPNYGSIGLIQSGVDSNYNALQVTVEKRFAQGLSFQGSYVWGKAMDDFAPNKDTPFFTNSCTCGRSFDYGPSDDDLTNTIKINGTYQTPHLRFNRVADHLLGGWAISGIMEWEPSGNPFTIMSGVDNSLSAIGADRAKLVNATNIKQAMIGHRPRPGVIGQWFNPNDFTVNDVGTFGDTGKNQLRGPGFFNSDISFMKNTGVYRDRLTLQLRADLFNATNHPNFGEPGNVVGSGGFGTIGGTLFSGAYGGPTSYGTAQPRIMQFGVKAIF